MRAGTAVLHCPECRRPEEIDDILRGNQEYILEIPKLAWALSFSQRGAVRCFGHDFLPDRWIPTPLPESLPRFADDVAGWTWPVGMAEWAWTQQLSYWRAQPPDGLLEVVGTAVGRIALALGPIPWIYESLAGANHGPGQPLATPGLPSPATGPPWEVFPTRSQWWHWVAWAAIGNLGGERSWECAPVDVWHGVSQTCHPQFTWQQIARVFRNSFSRAWSRTLRLPQLPPMTGLFNLWIRYETGTGWRLVAHAAHLPTLLALRATSREV